MSLLFSDLSFSHPLTLALVGGHRQFLGLSLELRLEEWQRNGTKEGKEPKPDSSLALERELEEKAALLESRCSLLESELQAKAQELSMSAHECESLRKRAKEELEEVRKALGSHVRENPDTISKGVHRLADLLRDSSWQRDTLERHVSGVTQELREKRRMLEEAESARAELERECEDLRDQLEEVQKGERPTPEGGPRAGGGGLPTIEEEEDAEGEGEGAEREVKEARRSPTGLGGEDEEEGEVAKMGMEEGGKDGKVRKRDGRDAKKEQAEDEEESSRLSRIHYLEAQVEALSEARRNLEIEVVRLRAEQGDALARLRDREEGRAGNILNLETEAASLRQVKVVLEEEVGTLKAEGHRRKEEKERLEEEVRALRQEGHAIREEKERLMGQLDTLTRQLDLEAVTHKDEREGLEEKQHALEEKIRTLEDELGHLRASEGLNAHERQSLGQQLLLQYRAVEERNELISRLEGELHDMTLKQAVLQAPERTLEDLRMQLEEREKELNAAKSQIIFKDDKVDELNQSLSELRGKITELTKSLSERDEKLRELSKEIQKRDEKVSELTQNLSENNDKVNEMTLEKMTEVSALKEQVEREREEIERKREEVERKEEELERKNGEMEQKKEEIERDREELKINKEELERNRDQLDHSETELFQLREKMEELINENKRREEEQKEKREEEEKKKTEERETWNKEKEALERVKENLVQEIEKAKLRESEREKQDDSTIKQRREEEEREEEERNRMKQQIECFRGEREEMIKALKQKHEESLAYHAEVQRLSAVLMQMNEHTKEFERAKKEEEEKMKTELEKTKKEEERVKVELEKARREEEKARREEERAKREQGEWEKGQKAITEERDQLRLANAQFNNQYQEQSKELAQLRERETRLASECERLRQHLINVEEAYTQEIVKGEERETTLKKALSKMEERMATVAASQRSSSHTEALLEQLREMTSQRDDAVLRLHDAEETAQQSQQSLGTLQKVLEDFQRRQSREILDATDRQVRALQEEKERALGLEEEIRALKMQLQEAQNGLDAASRLGEQLNRKESVIASLRAQGKCSK
nr:golgin subfamily A member 6-like protein 22 [Penaeus vannamei]